MTADVGQVMRVCPVCREQRAVAHCPPSNRGCFWLRCRNKTCAVVIDLRRRIACKPTGELIPLAPPKTGDK